MLLPPRRRAVPGYNAKSCLRALQRGPAGGEIVAQLVEHGTFNAVVVGSSPTDLTPKRLAARSAVFFCARWLVFLATKTRRALRTHKEGRFKLVTTETISLRFLFLLLRALFMS